MCIRWLVSASRDVKEWLGEWLCVCGQSDDLTSGRASDRVRIRTATQQVAQTDCRNWTFRLAGCHLFRIRQIPASVLCQGTRVPSQSTRSYWWAQLGHQITWLSLNGDVADGVCGLTSLSPESRVSSSDPFVWVRTTSLTSHKHNNWQQ